MGLKPDDYGEHLLDLLPGGRAWDKRTGSTLRELAIALGTEFARADNRGEALRDEADPQLTLELLAEWERVVGLPDECTGPLSDTQARRAAVLARLANRGGQTPAFYVALAATLGFEVEIVEYRPADCLSTCTASLTQDAWTHAWTVVAPLGTVRTATCLSTCADSLRSWGDDLLECTLRRVAPAHTVLLFAYVEDPNARHLVFIYLDDPPPLNPWASELPWDEGEGSQYENRLPQTPNLDALAAAGVIATRAKTTAVCSPGRATIQTGVHVHRHGLGAVVRPDYDGALSEFGDPGFQWPVLATRLAQNPDVRAGFFGKLHFAKDVDDGGLGLDLFEQRLGPWTVSHHVRNNHNNPPFVPGLDGSYYAFRKKVLPERVVVDVVDDYSVKHWFDRAREFIVKAAPSERLFVFIPQNTTHSPFDLPPDGTVATAEYLVEPPTIWRRQLAMAEAFDHYLGEFIASLPPEFVARATFVVAGDNGPDYAFIKSSFEDEDKVYSDVWEQLYENPERRFKAGIFRFGDWCQFSWTGPSTAAPGTKTTAPLHIVDVFATVCDYFNVEPGVGDGVSMLPHLHGGDPHPRMHGAQFSGFFMPNGDWQTIAPAPLVWDDATDYEVDDEVLHYGKNYRAAIASGPGNGGAVEPDLPGSASYWPDASWADFSMEADFDAGAGPDFAGRFKLVRRLGYPDRVWHTYRTDGTPVHPFELPGEELDTSSKFGGLVLAFLQGLLAAAFLDPPGPSDALGIIDEEDEEGTMRQLSGGGFSLLSAAGFSGTLAATDPPGDIPGRVRYDTADGTVGDIILQVAVAVSGGLPVTNASGFPGVLALVDGEAPVITFDAVAGSLELDENGATILDSDGVTGYLPVI